MPVVTLGTLLQIYDKIKECPGITRAEISNSFGRDIHWCNEPKLIAVETHIGLLSEDEDGRLFIFVNPRRGQDRYYGRR